MEQRKGRDEHIGQVVDDQIQQHPVKARRVGLDVIAAGQRTIDAVNKKRHHQPEEHQRPVFARGGQKRQHGKDRACGGEEMDQKGTALALHDRPHDSNRGLMQRVQASPRLGQRIADRVGARGRLLSDAFGQRCRRIAETAPDAGGHGPPGRQQDQTCLCRRGGKARSWTKPMPRPACMRRNSDPGRVRRSDARRHGR